REAAPPPARHRPGAGSARRPRCPSHVAQTAIAKKHDKGVPMSLVQVEVPRESADTAAPLERKDTPATREIRHEYTRSLPPLLSQLGVSLLVSTYQAGKIAAVGVAGGEL